MSSKNNTLSNIKTVPVKPRYIVLNEDIYHALDIFEASVYTALRFKADYRDKCSDIEMSIEDLMAASKVKRRMLFYCLNSLEKKHFLIRRINWDKGTFGQTNEYAVAQDLYYFKPIETVGNEEIEEEKPAENVHDEGNALNNNDNNNGSYIEGVHTVHTVVHQVHTVAQNAQVKGAFEIFWNAYPVKKNKKRAKQIWAAAKLDKKLAEIMEKLSLQCVNDADWKKGFVPHASTYLNGERWNDEISKDKGAVSSAPKIESKPSNFVVYSNFVSELKAMKSFGEIPDETKIPSFDEWQSKGITADAKVFKRGLNLGC